MAGGMGECVGGFHDWRQPAACSGGDDDGDGVPSPGRG